jgi:multidrug efflux system membrane fusion protein
MAAYQKPGSYRWNAIIGALVLLAIVVVGVREIAGRTPSATDAAEPAVPVTAAVAARADVPDFINTIGAVQSIDVVAILPQASGPIMKIEFKPGEDVTKGQELFLIDPRPYQAVLDQQQAQLAHDQAVLAEAQRDLERYQVLAKQTAIPTQQAEDQQYVVQQDKATVQVDEANVRTAQINLGYCHITAPISGRAGILQVDVGNVVGPGGTIAGQSAVRTTAAAASTGGATTPSGTTGQAATTGALVSIAQIKPIYVNFTLPETRLDEVRRKQAAAELDVEAYAQSGKLLEKGKLTVIDNQVNASTGTVSMQATFANADEVLWPGEFVSTRLIVSTRHDVVTVPAQTVMEGLNSTYVYVIGADQTVHRVDVQVTVRQSGIAVIGKGISAGEKVVTDGQYRLTDGIKVDVRQTTDTAAAPR